MKRVSFSRAPGRPVVLGEDDVRMRRELVERLVEVARPQARIAHLGAAQWAQVVHRVLAQLGEVQRAQAAGRRRTSPKAPRFRAPARRRSRRRRSHGARAPARWCASAGSGSMVPSAGLAEAAVDLPAGAARQGGAELELRAPRHRIAGDHVLRHRVPEEARPARRSARRGGSRPPRRSRRARRRSGRHGCGCRSRPSPAGRRAARGRASARPAAVSAQVSGSMMITP